MKKLILFTLIILGAYTLTAQTTNKPIITKSIYYGKSKPIREMNIILPGTHPKEQEVIANFYSSGKYDVKQINNKSAVPKTTLQRYQGSLKSKGPQLNFEGIDNVNGIFPADPNGDVSESYYMQTVNNSFAVWDKSGNLIYGPVDNKSLWEALPGPWHSINWTDPVFRYDYLAGRWVISSMSINKNQELYYEMVAVSETNDPLGAYNCYVFQFDLINDYPKLSVWHDGYYITYNMFENNPVSYYNSLVSVVDRDAMIAGESEITMIEFAMPDPGDVAFFPLAADLRGDNIPYDSPCYIVAINDHDTINPWFLSLDVYEFSTDWDVPANSSLNHVSQYDIGDVEPIVDFGPGAPQPINDKNVVTIPLFMMYPATYRMFENHESMVCCLTIYDGNIHYLKWFELRKETGDWDVYQEGNYAPDDSHRYQPSISINGNGDIAMGYTVSDEETFPSIRMTGRRAGDPLGVMTYQELELFTGLNYINTYQTSFDQNRWGDYASMMVDPVNDTTFWFTNMYPKSQTNSGNWGTRIFAVDLTEDFENVTAYAGIDTMICYSDYIFITQGEATNYNAIQWITTGDGSFVIDNIPNAKYLRGGQDIANGQVQLIIHASGYEPGSVAIDTMTLILDPCTGIEESIENELKLTISPNPTTGIVTVKAYTGINQYVILLVYDSQGKQLFTEEVITKATSYTRKLDFSFKDDGIYYFRLETENNLLTGKLVKTH
ncbi:MAG: hypothetical protein C0591_05100 [Marinilabiliales bacterium]|nr:MAG: hypothetical protein C0591_05100 [Marinilabiliales bacterium]